MSISISMISSSSSSSSSLLRFNAIPLTSKTPLSTPHLRRLTIRASSSHTPPVTQTLRRAAKAAVLLAAASAAALALNPAAARAQSPASAVEQAEELREDFASPSPSSPLSEFLGSNSEALEGLKALLQRKLESGEDGEALKILRQLASAQPAEAEWKFLTARVLAETGDVRGARQVFEEILAANPLSFEALFENALLMDRSGEGEAVIGRLEAALRVAEEANRAKEARDVKLIMAQVRFLQKNVDEAMRVYEELTKEDPSDFRPYFCRGMIYSLTDRNAEAREQFRKYRELSPRKFEVEGFLRTPLSRMKLFGTDEN